MFTSFDKAIAAFIVPVILGWLAPLGISGDTSVEQALNIIILGALTALSVYFTRNKK